MTFLADSFTSFTEPRRRPGGDRAAGGGRLTRCASRAAAAAAGPACPRAWSTTRRSRRAPWPGGSPRAPSPGSPIVGCEPSCLFTLRDEHRVAAARRPPRPRRRRPGPAGRGAARPRRSTTAGCVLADDSWLAGPQGALPRPLPPEGRGRHGRDGRAAARGSPASRWSSSTPAAAAWPGRSASRPSTTRCRCRSARTGCSPPCAPSPRTPSWPRPGSRAASRSQHGTERRGPAPAGAGPERAAVTAPGRHVRPVLGPARLAHGWVGGAGPAGPRPGLGRRRHAALRRLGPAQQGRPARLPRVAAVAGAGGARDGRGVRLPGARGATRPRPSRRWWPRCRTGRCGPTSPTGLPEVRRAGWRPGLLSSVDDDLFLSTAAAALVDHDVALTSERLGVYKPHAAVYHRAVELLGVAGARADVGPRRPRGAGGRHPRRTDAATRPRGRPRRAAARPRGRLHPRAARRAGHPPCVMVHGRLAGHAPAVAVRPWTTRRRWRTRRPPRPARRPPRPGRRCRRWRPAHRAARHRGTPGPRRSAA